MSILFKGNLEEGNYTLIKSTDGWVLKGETSYAGFNFADRPQGEWIDCKEPPSTDRNVFIAYGTDDMKSVCIGHYEHDMKMWYEDKNFFAKPLYDGMYWCEIPQFPAKMKGADDD